MCGFSWVFEKVAVKQPGAYRPLTGCLTATFCSKTTNKTSQKNALGTLAPKFEVWFGVGPLGGKWGKLGQVGQVGQVGTSGASGASRAGFK